MIRLSSLFKRINDKTFQVDVHIRNPYFVTRAIRTNHKEKHLITGQLPGHIATGLPWHQCSAALVGSIDYLQKNDSLKDVRVIYTNSPRDKQVFTQLENTHSVIIKRSHNKLVPNDVENAFKNLKNTLNISAKKVNSSCRYIKTDAGINLVDKRDTVWLTHKDAENLIGYRLFKDGNLEIIEVKDSDIENLVTDTTKVVFDSKVSLKSFYSKANVTELSGFVSPFGDRELRAQQTLNENVKNPLLYQLSQSANLFNTRFHELVKGRGSDGDYSVFYRGNEPVTVILSNATIFSQAILLTGVSAIGGPLRKFGQGEKFSTTHSVIDYRVCINGSIIFARDSLRRHQRSYHECNKICTSQNIFALLFFLL